MYTPFASLLRNRRSRKRRGGKFQTCPTKRFVRRLSLEVLEDRTLPSVTLIKDINTAPMGSNPYNTVAVNDTVFFTAADGTHGYELWKSDGTEQGTVMVKDINSGGSYFSGSYPYYPTDVNGTLFFTAWDPQHSYELWKSDGTEAGTVLVKDINAGPGFSFPFNLTNVNGTLFFTAFSPNFGGWELWKSDGTDAGTVLVRDIYPGFDSNCIAFNTLFFLNPNPTGCPGSSFPVDLTNINGTLYFAATDPNLGRELFKSDGTEAGTIPVTDINPGSSWSLPEQLRNVGGTLYFTADDYNGLTGAGRELWKSDGSALGTVRVADINPGVAGSFPSNLTNVNGTLFFSAQDPTNGRELWKSNATDGTVLVKDILPGVEDSAPAGLTSMDSKVFFTATNGVNGQELWKSDGTKAGTTLVKDIRTGAPGSDPSDLTNVNGKLLFSADDGTTGRELWISNGTAAGTVTVKDISPGSPGSVASFFAFFTSSNGALFFAADNGTTGTELWRSDGTSAGTRLVKDINTETGGSFASYPVEVNQALYFSADDGIHGRELWKSDGTEAGTVLVKDIHPGPASSDISEITNVNGTLYFRACNAPGPTFFFFGFTFQTAANCELWKSDGTAAGTVMVKDMFLFPPNDADGFANSSFPSDLTNVNGTLYFRACNEPGSHPLFDPRSNCELWKSNGTDAGTVMVKDIFPGTTPAGTGNSSFPFGLTALNDKLFFESFEPDSGFELWTSDGTEAGTVRVKDIFPGPGSGDPFFLTAINGTLYFPANDGQKGYELWKSDGTEAGTVLVKDVNPTAGSYPLFFTESNNSIFFTTLNDAAFGAELWKTDGTEAGTVLVKDINLGPALLLGRSSSPRQFGDVNGTLFFAANDGTNGRELWKSNGTEQGTILVKDINSGGTSYPGSYPYYLTAADGTLFFTAFDPEHGYELWQSDGLAAGTSLAEDIKPGGGTSFPYNLYSDGCDLFFTANDGAHGFELMKRAIHERDVLASPTSRLVTTEKGGTAQFSLVLGCKPASDVIIPLSLSDATEGALSKTSLRFTPLNWNVPQKVTVKGLDDAVDDGDIAYTIRTGAVTSADFKYRGIDTPDLSAINLDNDYSGIRVTAAPGLFTTEAGGTATFTVVLKSQPTANVTVQIFTSDPTEGRVSPSSLTFTPTTWNGPQTVRATGVDDNWDDGDIRWGVRVAPATSADSNYNNYNAPDVPIINRDNDTARLSISDVSVKEGNVGNRNAVFIVRLSIASTQTVRVRFVTANGAARAGSDYTAASGTLSFNPGRTTLVIPVEVRVDTENELNEIFYVNLGPATNATIADAQGIATILDDDG